jgi:plasmid stabilization system protein ParE
VARYVIRPEADRDLDEQADYYAEKENVELGLRFLDAAHETFALLASQPAIGRARKFRSPELAQARWQPVKHFPEHLVFYISTHACGH